MLLFTQCQLPEDELVPALLLEETLTSSSPRIVYRGEQTKTQAKNDTPQMTFGPEKVNPYNIDRMTTAWNNLYGQNVTKLPVTHRYVQFNPAGPQELLELEDAGFELIHFPLHYEIITFGEYDPPIATPGDIPPLYAIVPLKQTIASTFNHQVLEEYLLAPYNSYLTAEAFRLAGQTHEGVDTGIAADPVLGGDPPQNTGVDCDPNCPAYPCCFSTYVDCDDTPAPQDCLLLDVPCDVNSPHFPECLDEETEGNNEPPLTTDCGCPITGYIRRPAGCVQVVDTELPANTTLNGNPVHLRGVRNVKVRWWDGYVRFSTTETDGNGCFRFNVRERGHAWMWVKFKSNRVTVRGIRGARFWEYGMAVEDMARFGAPPYNDIRIIYDRALEDGSKAKSYWYAATANNALYEYDFMANQDNVPIPDQDLEITIANYDGAAAAPMLNQMFQYSGTAIPTFLAGTGILTILRINEVVPLASTLALYAQVYAPDVWYNYGIDENQGEGLRRSDRIKSTLYHEYAHATHYQALGAPFIANDYWLKNISYIVDNSTSGNNPPYGDGLEPGAGRTAIIEAWGNHIGALYADQFYGLNHSWSPTNFVEDQERTRWSSRLEAWDPNAAFGSPNFNDPADAWIPEGIFRDCIDNNTLNPLGVNEPIVDNVIGFNNADILAAMVRILEEPVTVEDLRDLLISDYLPANEVTADVNTLFGEYGY